MLIAYTYLAIVSLLVWEIAERNKPGFAVIDLTTGKRVR